ncbi:hypothetical protein KFE25_003801 [Diacronema lutheri]|uniref:Uncharacterized protein n=2 Tax=Diacronema lutheri TaxID=2081491 RepID=A0A8J5XG91_DIALT|nr:hypothetical protein KFE25_003801 [Diacronema lutheri]
MLPDRSPALRGARDAQCRGRAFDRRSATARRWPAVALAAVLAAVALVGVAFWARPARRRFWLGGRALAAFGNDADVDPRAWLEAGRHACALGARARAPPPVLIGATPTHRIIAPYGVLLFAYGESAELVRKYGAEAVQTAEALRRTNPRLPIAIASNFPNVSAASGARLFRTPPFALVLPIRHDHMVYPSTVRPRYEWVTRAHYMALSPFELTLALDSHALPCTADDARDEAAARAGASAHPRASAAERVARVRPARAWRAGNELAAVLEALPAVGSARRWFDLAFNTFLTSGRPHNWALLYYTRAPAMRALFTDWYLAYLAQGGDDQGPLEHAARARARAGGLRLARMHANFAGAFERVDDFQRSDWPRATHVLSGAAHLFHVRYADEQMRRQLCAMLNARAHIRRRRVLIQPRGGHKGLYAHAWPVVFSAAEYTAATGYSPPPAGHVNEFAFAQPACASASNLSADETGGEPLVYPFDQHARLACWRSA